MIAKEATGRPPHIQKLFDEANNIELDSKKYWELRARYREKMDDMTYGKDERDNCFQLWRILINR